MNIKDYLHLYLGCEIELEYKGKKIIERLDSINLRTGRIDTKTFVDFDFDVKPILRPLSDMTEEERRQWLDFRLNSRIEPERSFQLSEAMRTKFLLSKYFDLFGLIEAGLAIDATIKAEQIKIFQ